MLYVVLSLLIRSVWSSAGGGQPPASPLVHRTDSDAPPWRTAAGEWKLGNVCLIVHDAAKYPGTLAQMKAALENEAWAGKLMTKVDDLERWGSGILVRNHCFKWPQQFQEERGKVSKGFVNLPSVEDVRKSIEDAFTRFNSEISEDTRISESNAMNYLSMHEVQGSDKAKVEEVTDIVKLFSLAIATQHALDKMMGRAKKLGESEIQSKTILKEAETEYESLAGEYVSLYSHQLLFLRNRILLGGTLQKDLVSLPTEIFSKRIALVDEAVNKAAEHINEAAAALGKPVVAPDMAAIRERVKTEFTSEVQRKADDIARDMRSEVFIAKKHIQTEINAMKFRAVGEYKRKMVLARGVIGNEKIQEEVHALDASVFDELLVFAENSVALRDLIKTSQEQILRLSDLLKNLDSAGTHQLTAGLLFSINDAIQNLSATRQKLTNMHNAYAKLLAKPTPLLRDLIIKNVELISKQVNIIRLQTDKAETVVKKRSLRTPQTIVVNQIGEGRQDGVNLTLNRQFDGFKWTMGKTIACAAILVVGGLAVLAFVLTRR